MTARGGRVAARWCAVVGAAALVTATASPAQAEPTYDGSATALRIDEVTLTLFPADAKLPKPLQGMERPEPQRISLTDQLGLPDRVGYATYQAVDNPAALPHNPVINAGAFRASSTKENGIVVSEATISELEVAGGALAAESITARCEGDGKEISLSAPVTKLEGNQLPVKSSVELTANQATSIPGVGSITWNQQDTDGSTYGEVSNIVIELDSNLSLDVLKKIPGAAAEFERGLKDVIKQLGKSGQGTPLAGAADQLRAPVEDLSGKQLYNALDRVLRRVPTEELPDLNSVLALDGTITLANVECSQAPAGVDEPEQDEPPANPAGTTTTPTSNEPKQTPLADTGASSSPAELTGLAAGGLLALVAGAYAIIRARRRA